MKSNHRSCALRSHLPDGQLTGFQGDSQLRRECTVIQQDKMSDGVAGAGTQWDPKPSSEPVSTRALHKHTLLQFLSQLPVKKD